MLDFQQKMATKMAREIMEEQFGSFNLSEPECAPVVAKKARGRGGLPGFFFAKRRQRPVARREPAIEVNCGGDARAV